MKKLIGLSVSRCFPDMASGEVDPAQVAFITSNTMFANKVQALKEIERVYIPLYDWDKTTIALFMNFWDQGKIEQPRLEGMDNLYVTSSWVEVEVEE